MIIVTGSLPKFAENMRTQSSRESRDPNGLELPMMLVPVLMHSLYDLPLLLLVLALLVAIWIVRKSF